MRDNLSIVITVIVLVLLMVIFPLYNFFERQDDMSYNLVLKSTTNFVDQVMNNGYIDQNTYDKFVTELANTGNVYDIQIEAHRKVLIDADITDTYVEQSYIDYSDDIFNAIDTTSTNDSNLMKKILKNNIYLFNPKDEIYVKVKNSNTTMAASLFNTIVPASKKTRIEVNYGGIIKNNAWKNVDATYTGHNMAPGSPIIFLSEESTNYKREIINNEEQTHQLIDKNFAFNGYKFIAESTAFEGFDISKYFWTVTNEEDKSEIQKYNSASNDLNDISFKPGNKYIIEVYSVNTAGYKSDTTKINIEITGADSPETSILGDLNNNYVLDDGDIAILKAYLDVKYSFNDKQKEKSNINGDNTIDQIDLNYLTELVRNGYILGDVNKDNNVNSTDAALVQKYINKTTNLDEEQLKRADINKDGNVDEKDVDLIQKKSLGMNVE